MSGIPTSSGGDAFLEGGLTEAAPQEFTGFNNFTKDTHFDEDIDADDTIRLNGSSAAANIAAISMVGGDNGGVVGGNTIGQNEAGTYGNSIYQISDTTVPLVLPAANGCIIHQTGNTDIIRTEGKVQMALAPAVGDDLCNKTYVDAAGGGSFLGMRAYLTNPSGSAQNPFKFGGNSYCVPATLYDNTTGFYTIPSSGKYFFSIRVNWINASSGNPPQVNCFLVSSSGAALIRFLTVVEPSIAAAPYGFIYGADTIELTAGETLKWNWNLGGTFSQLLTGSIESVIICEKVA